MLPKRKSDSKHFGEDSLQLGVDGKNQRAELGWDVGVFVQLFLFGLGHGNADIQFLVLVQQPVVAGFFRLPSNVSGDLGVIDLVDDGCNLF